MVIFIIIIILIVFISGLGIYNYNLIKSLKKERDQLDKTAKILVKRDLELTEANERLQEIDKLKSEFISVAAHQLRTPLSGIKWILKMVMDGDMGEIAQEQREFLQRGYQANERIINLVNDLLNVSRIEEGRFGYSFVNYDLVKLIQEVVQDNKDIFARKNLQLEFIKSEKKLPKVKVDPDKLRLAIQNLLDNAHDYTLKGKVIINAVQKNNEIQVSIKDAGAGIPESQKANIFNKFFRGSNVIKLDTDGTGLGLFIAQNIIQKHDGSIWFKSQENKGTTFYFTLPLSKNHEKNFNYRR